MWRTTRRTVGISATSFSPPIPPSPTALVGSSSSTRLFTRNQTVASSSPRSSRIRALLLESRWGSDWAFFDLVQVEFMDCFCFLLQVDKGTAALNGTDGETTTQGKNVCICKFPYWCFNTLVCLFKLLIALHWFLNCAKTPPGLRWVIHN